MPLHGKFRKTKGVKRPRRLPGRRAARYGPPAHDHGTARSNPTSLPGDLNRLTSLILSNMRNVVVFCLTPDLRIAWASPSLEFYSAQSCEKALGRFCHDLLHERETSCPGCPAREAVRTGRTQESETATPDGRTWRLTSNPIMDASGRVSAIVHVATDVSQLALAKEELRQSKERLRLLVDNMPVLVHAHDENLHYIYWNKEAERVTGWSASQVVGDPRAAERLYPDPAIREDVIRASHRAGNYRDLEAEITCADGSTRIISWSTVSATPPIRGWGIWEVGVDVTEKRRAAARREQVERVMRHDVRRPLCQAVEMAVLLRDMGGLSAEQAELVHELEQSGRDGLALIDAALKLERLETGCCLSEAVRVDLRDLTRQAVERARTWEAANGMRLLLDGPGPDDTRLEVLGEPVLLGSMFENILLNAVQASPEGAAVRVEIGRDNGQGRIEGRNTGVIPLAIRPRFFEKYTTWGKHGGTGLGAYAARLVARAHGGEITAESRQGGTSVVIRLPLAP